MQSLMMLQLLVLLRLPHHPRHLPRHQLVVVVVVAVAVAEVEVGVVAVVEVDCMDIDYMDHIVGIVAVVEVVVEDNNHHRLPRINKKL